MLLMADEPSIDYLELFASKTVESFDEPLTFRTVVTYTLPDGRVYQRTTARIEKLNPFVADRGVITIDFCDGTGIQQRHESTLIKTVGSVDNDNEFTAWVECRLPGTDQVVHRSQTTMLKRTPGIGAEQGRF
jgi:hypothetical protein